MENSRDSANNTQNTQDHIKTLEGKEAVKKLKDEFPDSKYQQYTEKHSYITQIVNS